MQINLEETSQQVPNMVNLLVAQYLSFFFVTYDQ